MIISKTTFLPKGVELPYKVKVEDPKFTVGIFGDSFAQLAEFSELSTNFTHESSWIYFLANILKADCETYGLSRASMGDIFQTLFECKTTYDYYIIFHTNPTRSNKFSDVKFNLKTCNEVKNFIEKKEVLIVYWDKSHNIFDYNKPYTYCNYHLSNKNIPDEGEIPNPINQLDQTGGHHHMSARGNLLFALQLSKLMFASSLKN